jgi:biotin carboxyl carrier protein
LCQQKFADAAAAFATDLAAIAHFDRAAIGMVTDNRLGVTLAATSHTDFQPNTELFHAFNAAMDEAYDQGTTIVSPALNRSRPLITVAHTELGKRYGGAACTIPLVNNNEIFGAVTLVRTDSTPPNARAIAQWEQIASLVGPVLRLKYELERSLLTRLSRALRKSSHSIVAPGNMKSKVIATVGLASLFGMLFLPMPYHIGASAHIEGSIQRVLVAPADGFLRQVYARPGDLVKATQVVAELAADDLSIEHRKWHSEHLQHVNAASAALARADRTQFVISQALADEARAQLDLVAMQISRVNIVAPFNGVVIAGDLSQSLGAPVQRGEVLLTVAPADEFRLVIDVDERDIATVTKNQKGKVALAALNDRPLEFNVERVTPVATALDGRNYFEVEGKLTEAPPLLRPGLQGVAKIDAGKRPLGWIWSHRLVDWLRLTLWYWGA